MDDRAVSRVLSYTLVVAISTVLVAGLLISGSSFVGDQRSQVVDSELDVIGQRLAADIATADRLVRMGDGQTTVKIDSRLPDRVAGQHYNVEVIPEDGNVSLRIQTPALDRRAVVPVSNTTAVAAGQAAGGDVVIEYDRSNDRLEVRNA